jgi:hypothetical protein
LARRQDAGLTSVFTSVSRLSAPSSRQRSNARLRFHFLDLRSARPLAFFFFFLDFVGRFFWRRFCRPARAQIRPAAIPWPAPVVRPWARFLVREQARQAAPDSDFLCCELCALEPVFVLGSSRLARRAPSVCPRSRSSFSA